MIRRFLLYFLCLSVTLLYCCQDPLEPEDEGGSDPDTELPTEPEKPPVLPDIPTDPDDPSNPENPPVNPPVDPPVDPTDPENPPVNPPVDPTDPENPPVDPPVDPTDPEEPEQPYVPQVLLFETFKDRVIPEDYKVYDQDHQQEYYSNPGGTWAANTGKSVVSYAVFGNLEAKTMPAIGSSTPVDNWIVTKGVKITRTNTKLSWTVLATGLEVNLGTSKDRDIRATPKDALDTYEVYISTVGQSVADMKSTPPIYTTSTLPQAIAQSREIDLDAYVGKTIYIAFRHCSPRHNLTIVQLSNIKVREYSGAELAVSNVQTGPLYNHDKAGCVFRNNQTVEVRALIYNNGTLTAPSVEATYTYNKQKVTQTFVGNIPRGAYKTVVFTQKLTVDTPGTSQQVVVELENDEVVGNNTAATQIICPDTEPEKRVLYEKMTAVGCPACGSAMYRIDDLEKAYLGKIIGIAAHLSDIIGYDEMGCEDTYRGWIEKYHNQLYVKTTLPSSVINKRNNSGNVDKALREMISPASLDVEVDYDPQSRGMKITANTVFVSNATCKGYFRIGFVVTEDGLKAWQNRAPLDPDGNPYDIHNHTARVLLGGINGFENSLPETVTKGIKNSYTINHTIPAQYNHDKSHQPKPENMSVIAILYNEITGEVLNCARTKVIN